MNLTSDVAHLATKLITRGAEARAVMVAPVCPGSGASSVAASLAVSAAQSSGRPVWLYDLDFSKNNQAQRFGVAGPAYAGDFGDQKIWRAHPGGDQARLVLRRAPSLPVFVSQFDYVPRSIQQLDFVPNKAYWDQARKSCGLVLVDVPARLSGAVAFSRNMDGVILVADAGRVNQAMIDDMAVNFEDQGARIYGVILNRDESGAAMQGPRAA